jgi:hypothetical protein
MAKQQIHEAHVQITRSLTLPQYEQGGVEFELPAHGKKLGDVVFTGANVYFTPSRGTTKSWDFTHFVELLRNAPSQH